MRHNEPKLHQTTYIDT
jgi:hypothetical protein